MKKKIISILLALIMIMSIPLTAFAATPRTLIINPGLYFNDYVAECTLTVSGYNATNEIGATFRLWYGNRIMATWTASGTGYIIFAEEYTVRVTGEYRLTVDVTIDGVLQPRVSVSNDCT